MPGKKRLCCCIVLEISVGKKTKGETSDLLHRVHLSPSVGHQLRGPNDCSNSSMLMEMSQLSVTDLFSGPSHSVVFRRSKSIFSILLLNLARAGARTTTADMDGRYLGGVWFIQFAAGTDYSADG